MVTTRMRDRLKASLEQAAAADQRSLSEEIEHRLEESLRLRELGMSFGRPELFWQMHLLGNVIRFVEKKTGKLWDEDPETNHESIKAVVTAMMNLGRAKGGEEPVRGDNSLGAIVGKVAVQDYLARLAILKDKEKPS